MKKQKKTEISANLRLLVINKYNEGEKQKKICNDLLINYNSVKTIIRRYNKKGAVKIQKRIGRPKKITTTGERLIKRLALANRRKKLKDITTLYNNNHGNLISKSTVHRILEKQGITKKKAIKKPFINLENRKKRLKWARKHAKWTLEDWNTCYIY
jgi:transposase